MKGSFWNFIKSKKNDDNESKPTVAHLGEENKFYFNKELNRWVIKGEEDKIENEEKISAPPKMNTLQNANQGYRSLVQQNKMRSAFNIYAETPGLKTIKKKNVLVQGGIVSPYMESLKNEKGSSSSNNNPSDNKTEAFGSNIFIPSNNKVYENKVKDNKYVVENDENYINNEQKKQKTNTLENKNYNEEVKEKNVLNTSYENISQLNKSTGMDVFLKKQSYTKNDDSMFTKVYSNENIIDTSHKNNNLDKTFNDNISNENNNFGYSKNEESKIMTPIQSNMHIPVISRRETKPTSFDNLHKFYEIKRNETKEIKSLKVVWNPNKDAENQTDVYNNNNNNNNNNNHSYNNNNNNNNNVETVFEKKDKNVQDSIYKVSNSTFLSPFGESKNETFPRKSMVHINNLENINIKNVQEDEIYDESNKINDPLESNNGYDEMHRSFFIPEERESINMSKKKNNINVDHNNVNVDHNNVNVDHNNVNVDHNNINVDDKNINVDDKNINVDDKNINVDDNYINVDNNNINVDGNNNILVNDNPRHDKYNDSDFSHDNYLNYDKDYFVQKEKDFVEHFITILKNHLNEDNNFVNSLIKTQTEKVNSFVNENKKSLNILYNKINEFDKYKNDDNMDNVTQKHVNNNIDNNRDICSTDLKEDDILNEKGKELNNLLYIINIKNKKIKSELECFITSFNNLKKLKMKNEEIISIYKTREKELIEAINVLEDRYEKKNCLFKKKERHYKELLIQKDNDLNMEQMNYEKNVQYLKKQENLLKQELEQVQIKTKEQIITLKEELEKKKNEEWEILQKEQDENMKKNIDIEINKIKEELKNKYEEETKDKVEQIKQLTENDFHLKLEQYKEQIEKDKNDFINNLNIEKNNEIEIFKNNIEKMKNEEISKMNEENQKVCTENKEKDNLLEQQKKELENIKEQWETEKQKEIEVLKNEIYSQNKEKEEFLKQELQNNYNEQINQLKEELNEQLEEKYKYEYEIKIQNVLNRKQEENQQKWDNEKQQIIQMYEQKLLLQKDNIEQTLNIQNQQWQENMQLQKDKQIDILNEKIDKLDMETKLLNEKKNELEINISLLNEENMNILNQNQNLEDNLKNNEDIYQKKLSILSDQNCKLEEEMKRIKEDHTKESEEIQEKFADLLEEEIDRIRKESESKVESYIKQYEEINEEYTKKKEEYDQLLEKANQNNKELTEKYEENIQKINEYEDMIRILENKTEEMVHKKIEELTIEFEKKKRDFIDNEKQVLLSNYEELLEENKHMKEQLGNQTNLTIRENEEKILEITQNYEMKVKEIEKDYEDLLNQYNNIKYENKEILEKWNIEKETKEKELKDLNNINTQLSSENNEFHLTYKNLKEEIIQLQNKYEEVKEENIFLKNEEHKKLTDKLKNLENINKNLMDVTEKERELNLKNVNIIKCLQQQINEQTKLYKEYTDELNNEIKTLKQSKHIHTDHTSNNNHKNNGYNDNIELIEENKKLKLQNEVISTKNDTISTVLDNLTKRLSFIESKIKEKDFGLDIIKQADHLQLQDFK
ncbi:conserved Plasmodium protein, unknown function [Plasmodium reichenowi]|uniref:Uncharacterized protein n=1 Tax=Plasmodium reichenowi TaxID=5854 RepID=A0A2P9DGJ1_PLARE|nr:conserved Plasmodium protein, unknown function [Plasmodium reichenowi]